MRPALRHFILTCFLGTLSAALGGHPPLITRHPVPQVCMAGENVTLIGATSDVLATSWQWEKDNQPVPGANSGTLVLRHVRSADAGEYRLVISNNRSVAGAPPLGESVTRSAVVTVIEPPLAAGQQDMSFGDHVPPGMAAQAILPLPDGGALVGGNGPPYLLRIAADGTLVPGFFGTGPSARVRCLAAHGDGYLAGGDFTSFAGRAASRIVRLRADGLPDPAFQQPGLSENVRTMAVQNVDGEPRILAGLPKLPFLVRLRADGTIDPTFQPGAINGRVSALHVQPDGRILVGGSFSADAAWPYDRIARLLPNGAPDTASFTPVLMNTGGEEVLAIALQANGRILLGGKFARVSGLLASNLARLLPDGTPDNGFAPVTNSPVNSIALQPDGMILAGGEFSRIAGLNHLRLARLTPAGASDPAWTGCGLNEKVNALAVRDGSVLAAASFTRPHTALVKLALSAPAWPPLSTAPPAARTVEPGHSLLLTAAIRSLPDTTYAWTRPGAPPILTEIPELFIPSATATHAGPWTVQAASAAGSLTWGPLQVTLRIAAPGIRPHFQYSPAGIPAAVPELGTLNLPVLLPDVTIDELRVHLSLRHSDADDLGATLLSPSGDTIPLLRAGQLRRGNDFAHTVFSDDAPQEVTDSASPHRGLWKPASSRVFDVLRRPHAAGQWTISITDTRADSSVGTVTFAAIEVFSPAQLPAFGSSLPMQSFFLTEQTAALRHWNAPAGSTARCEFSTGLANWQTAELLSLCQEADLSQTHTVLRPPLPGAFFRLVVP